MFQINKNDYKMLTTICQMKEQNLIKSLNNILIKYYNNKNIIYTKDYILCEGSIPVMLVAHLDTVFKQPPSAIYYDQKQNIMWSPNGLGADDRAGVFSILKIIQNGYRPHICFTTGEEHGGIGANILIHQIPICPFKTKYLIELDRQGKEDCVFYSCDNEKFQEYIESFGFVTDWGTFSDISTICPAWKIAGVNLSIGYVNEHSISETLNTKVMFNTIEKVQKILNNAETAESYIYVEGYDYYFGNYNFNLKNLKTVCKCSQCNKILNKDDAFEFKTQTKGTKTFCLDCIADNKINWCSRCGDPFEAENGHKKDLCDKCAKESNK